MVSHQHDATTTTATTQVVRRAATGIAGSVASFSTVRGDFAFALEGSPTNENEQPSGAVLAVLRLYILAAAPTLTT